MKHGPFLRFLKEIGELNDNQLKKVIDIAQNKLDKKDTGIEEIIPPKPTGVSCPHCYQPARRWGKHTGLQRYKCKSCEKTFNALTKTSFSRLRYRDKWKKASEAILEGCTIKESSEKLGICVDTAFRWRHRFLDGVSNQGHPELGGIVEIDETLFRTSEKGQRNLQRKAKKRGEKASTAGRGEEQVMVCVARDRNKRTAHLVSAEMNKEKVEEILDPIIQDDSILCSDGLKSFKSYSLKKHIQHVVLNASQQERVKEGVFHIQNVNAYHSRLKAWMIRFNGVATKYLGNYVEWFRHHSRISEGLISKEPSYFLSLAISTT